MRYELDPRPLSRRRMLQGSLTAAATIAVGGLLPTTARAAAANGIRRGVQAVLLPYWPINSVTRMLSILKDTRAPGALEIALCPWPELSPSPASYFVNARRVVDELRGVGKTVAMTMHLSFHAKGSGFDDRIAQRAAKFAGEFAGTYVSRCKLTVCPSLEDYGSDADFLRWSKLLTQNIPASVRANLAIRRNSTKSNGTAGVTGFGSGVTTESHGGITSVPNAYSNDGNFVYYDDGKKNRENGSSLDDGSSPTYSIDTFATTTASKDVTTNLWRPAYNHLKKTTRSNGSVTYSKTGRTLGSDSFDDIEKTVLRKFLGF